MRWRAPVVSLMFLGVLASVLFLLARAGAQEELLGFPIIYLGKVTAGGTPVPDGLAITARMGDREFGPVFTSKGEYPGLTVNGPQADTGKKVSFWLQGVVKADQEDTFTFQERPRDPAVKTLDLTFSHVPEPTPTPTPTPTITPTPLPLGPLKVSLQAPGGGAVHLGDEFTLEVASTPEGHRLLRGEVVVGFDPRAVKLLESRVGSLLPLAVFAPTAGPSSVQGVFFQVEPTAPLREPGSLVVLRFKARQDAPAVTTEVSLLRMTVVDHLNQQFPLNQQVVSLKLSLEGVPGDINRSGQVDVIDLALLGAAFGSREGDAAYKGAADLNEDGVVGTQDVEVLRGYYGKRAR